MRTLLLIQRKRRQKKPWYCTFCGNPLYNCLGGSGIYWCPYCRRWHHINLSLLGKGSMNHTFIEKIAIELIPRASTTKMAERLNILLNESKIKIITQVKVYTAEEYSQEYLLSLIPSLCKKK